MRIRFKYFRNYMDNFSMVSLIVLITLASVFSIAAGISKAVTDVILFRFEQSIFKNKNIFWNPKESWKNKYKDGDPNKGDKFFMSSTFLVMFTDAWHLFGFLERITLSSAFLLIGLLINKNIWFISGTFIVYIIFFSIFHLFFTRIFIKK